MDSSLPDRKNIATVQHTERTFLSRGKRSVFEESCASYIWLELFLRRYLFSSGAAVVVFKKVTRPAPF